MRGFPGVISRIDHQLKSYIVSLPFIVSRESLNTSYESNLSQWTDIPHASRSSRDLKHDIKVRLHSDITPPLNGMAAKVVSNFMSQDICQLGFVFGSKN